ncbi:MULTISPECIES: hypothetical protein [Cyanophyceae]|uniref:hypothetical protein n=1 Tax=Cyanophyceae TaxID=3028117 RepID=UPI001683CE44|nr:MULTISPECIES: hypothetical protein [Cyanophyceae]MBD1917338.1 hypothetical protein [Phormidium sp. FACHB-77]MBD2032261.1 hypothetical protein [Phormidium sp. FACHB-322]MBD2053299.1 hypothetical protein [Leptolyngbya sp. FACHB-60]
MKSPTILLVVKGCLCSLGKAALSRWLFEAGLDGGRCPYQRWIAGKTEAKLSLAQLKALSRELGLERIEDIPDDFSAR